jgi:hypothetical protein
MVTGPTCDDYVSGLKLETALPLVIIVVHSKQYHVQVC